MYILILSLILIGCIAILVLKEKITNYKLYPEYHKGWHELSKINRKLKKNNTDNSLRAELLYDAGLVCWKCRSSLNRMTISSTLDPYNNEKAFCYFIKAARLNHKGAAFMAGIVACYGMLPDNTIEPLRFVNKSVKNAVYQVLNHYSIPNVYFANNAEGRVCGMFYFVKAHYLGSKEAAEKITAAIRDSEFPKSAISEINSMIKSGHVIF